MSGKATADRANSTRRSVRAPGSAGLSAQDLIDPLAVRRRVFSSGVNETLETGVYTRGGPRIIMACGTYFEPAS